MAHRAEPRFAGVEAGGTKFVCAVGTGPDGIEAEAVIPTTTPPETLGRVVRFFREQAPLAAVGLAAFGPLDLDPRSPTFGWITATPKPGWADTDVVGPLARALGVPTALDTDVNAAALAENRWGAGRGVANLVYVTVGTGIGGGALVRGVPVHGLVHPEMGHVRIPHDRAADPFPGSCPFHGDCLEGLASAPALRARWGADPADLPPDHPAWELEARYLAVGLSTIVMVLSPERIVIGGGVLRAPGLLGKIRRELSATLAGYVRSSAMSALDRYVVAAALGDRAGILGALELARRAPGAT